MSSSKGTGFVCDSRCDKHACAQDPDHNERPARTQRIHEDMEKSGLLSRCVYIKDVRPVNDFRLKRVHNLFSQPYVAALDVGKPTWIDEDTYFNEHSLECARLACGGLLSLCDHVMTGKVANGFAAIRPPGHHADADSIRGFCIFNNVAVAAEHLLKQYPSIVKRIMIVDWDVHHGDGTEEIFWDRSDVLYLSIHRYDNGDFYPRSGHAKNIGGPNSQGMNVNIPYDGVGNGDAEYLLAWKKVVIPIATAYKPDVILVSAGFDCAINDPLGRQNVSPECFAHLTQQLMHIPSSAAPVAPPPSSRLDHLTRLLLSTQTDTKSPPPSEAAPASTKQPTDAKSTPSSDAPEAVTSAAEAASAASAVSATSTGASIKFPETSGVARVIMALEGGYNLDSLGASATACVRALLGDPLPELKGGADKPDAYVNPKFVQSLQQVILTHQNFWPKGTLSNILSSSTPEKPPTAAAAAIRRSRPLDPTQEEEDPIYRAAAADLRKSLQNLHL